MKCRDDKQYTINDVQCIMYNLPLGTWPLIWTNLNTQRLGQVWFKFGQWLCRRLKSVHISFNYVHCSYVLPMSYFPEVLIINKILTTFSYSYLRLNFVIVIGRYFHQVYSRLFLESSVLFCYLHSKCCSRFC